ncbi:cell division protein [Tannerella sp. oral taxon BU063 isolate Cell 6/7/9]|uniref:Cell division protein n=2 Tax=Tannerella serpentiformis TaxID=712710 RepID=W2CQK9_9BACT|nr:cell division protein [Tannerella sp. oral taxon BU063 isolate Cell 6/7/9]ETK08692.1 cell division protein [Tannerella sp. oral taxon BU063 isolate Cell 1/3]
MLGVTLCLVFAIGTVSCKSKQSAYKAAYEQAKEREISSDEPTDEEIAPVTKSKDSGETRQEKITPVEGEDADAIKLYSVVVGSFKNRTNAFSLKERMQNEGYTPVLGENEQGMLRVIVTSFETKAEAEKSRDAIRAKYRPNFQDAWVLERTY